MDFAITLIAAAHLLAMGVASTGPLFCVLLGWRARDGSRAAEHAGRRLCWLSIGGLLLGCCLGGLLVLLCNASYWNVLQRIPARAYWFALAELGVSLVVMLIYAFAWRRVVRIPWLGEFLALFSVTNLLYHFPPLMIVLGRLGSGEMIARDQVLDRSALLKLMYQTEVVAPWIHYVLAAIAGAGAVHLLMPRDTSDDSEEGQAHWNRALRLTAGVMGAAILLELPVGLWLLTAISNASRNALMGSSLLASIAFLSSLLVAFLLLGRLLKVALGDFAQNDLRISAGMTFLIFALMTVSLRESRPKVEIQTGRVEPVNTAREMLDAG